MHFTGVTDYSADTFLTGYGAISRTKKKYYTLDNIKHMKVSYKAFKSVTVFSSDFVSYNYTDFLQNLFFFFFTLPIFYPDHVHYG